MLKDSDSWWLHPLMGFAIPKPTLFQFGQKICESLDDWIHDPAKREAAARSAASDLKRLFSDHRRIASQHAADRGVALLKFRKLHGRGSYHDHLLDIGVSPRTANNLIRLAFLRWRAPRLFDRLAPLGPTKLYRIALLDEAQLHTLDPDVAVTVDHRELKLRHLTDRELIRYLRKRFPPACRPHWTKIRTVALRLRTLLERDATREPVKPESLELVRDAAQAAVNRIANRIAQAC